MPSCFVNGLNVDGHHNDVIRKIYKYNSNEYLRNNSKYDFFGIWAFCYSKLLVQLVSWNFIITWIRIERSESGDSYTQTGFEPNGTLPAVGNPLGNPPYPVLYP